MSEVAGFAQVQAGRFSVRWTKRVANLGQPPGYAVFDRGRPITIPFETKEEAERHKHGIAAIYERFGW